MIATQSPQKERKRLRAAVRTRPTPEQSRSGKSVNIAVAMGVADIVVLGGDEKRKKPRRVRINKYLTEANFCSRRQADRLIEEGRVRINSQKAKLGDQVELSDKVFADDKLIKIVKKKVYLAYNKPVGVITTTDKGAKDNIISRIEYSARVYPIGRLDVNTSGLILLTNDGEIVNKILKGKNKVEKEYEVTVNKKISKEFLAGLEKGVVLDGHKTLPARSKKISDRKFRIVIVEGKNRQVRRMVSKLGMEAVKLKRIRIGGLTLDNLNISEGDYVKLTEEQVNSLI